MEKNKKQKQQNLISKKDGVHKVLLLMKEIRDVQSGSSCAVHKHGGKETDTSSKQSGKERFNQGLGWTCHQVDFSWTVQVLVLLG